MAVSPTPWVADPDYRDGMEWNIHIVEASRPDMRVCFMTSGPEAQHNAAFIVRACNSHDAMVTALQATQGRIMNAKIDLTTGHTKAAAVRTLDEIIKFIDTAISSIEGEAK